MSDPTNPEVPEADAVEQATPAAGTRAAGDPRPDDVPEADAAEQATPAYAPPSGSRLEDVPVEADPADVAEQAAVVDDDGADDYR